MIIGTYPCCGKELCLEVPDQPAYAKEDCPHCGETVWHWLSRVSPQSWTEYPFLSSHNVDEKTKKITRKKLEAE